MSELITELYGEGFGKTPFQVLLQLDRYAVKELDTTKLQEGDVVVAIVDDSDPSHPQKDWGCVTALTGEDVTFTGEMNQQEYTVNMRKVYIPLDYKWADSVCRMMDGNMEVDRTYTDSEVDSAFEERIYDALYNECLVPGGRVQAMLGAEEYLGKELNLTAYNCYVIPSPMDSRRGITDTLGTMAEIMARGGGVGINLSTLRPKYAKIYGVNGTSSGSVSWGGVYSYVTGLIETGGSRRGALMLQLHCSHPDLLDFITVKRQMGQITNANLSIQITAEFMEAVKQDADWKLIFPDTTHPMYDAEWGQKYQDIHDWLEDGLPVEVYKTAKAREIYDLIIESAWKAAEPGFVVYDRMNSGRMASTQNLWAVANEETGRVLYELAPVDDVMAVIPWNNTWYYQKNICTNPCGEQPLPGFGVCNLLHINLAEFFHEETGDVDWWMLQQTIHDAVRFADNVIDYTPYHLEENRKVQLGQRRIGLGTMGLADLLIDLKIRYGSDECIEFLDRLYGFIKNEAYRASALLARDRGAFPMYSSELLAARIPRSLDADVYELIEQHGLRNSHLLTQAPTGTTATKTGRFGYSVGTGIEPFFALEWTRKSRMGTAKDYLGKAKRWLDANPGQPLPDYFVSAMGVESDGTPQITPRQHVAVQAVIQKHNDSAISKTTNAPNHYTIEQTADLYQYGFEQGLLGITIYRDGSRDEQVLSAADDKPEGIPAPVVEERPHGKPFYKRPKCLRGETVKTPTPFGKAYMTINRNEADEIEEIFIKLGKTGADIAAISDGLAIALTGMLSPRIANLTQTEKLDWLVKKFKGISGDTVTGFGPNRVESLPDAIAKVLALVEQPEAGEEAYDTIPATHKTVQLDSTDICPSCGQSTFVKQDGCHTCLPDLGGCGHSKCG